MFRKFLPTPIKKWLQIRKDLAACHRFDRRRMNQIFNQMIEKIDTRSLDRLYSISHTTLKKNPAAAPKYYNYKEWLEVNIIRAAQCQLHIRNHLDILDLGCGPGWFLAVSRHLGHTATGMEIPMHDLTPEDKTVYQNIPEINDCRDHIVRHRIKPFVPIDIRGSFDLITAFQVCFNNHKKPDIWGKNEWHFFIQDLKSHLKKQGQIVLELNADTINFPEKLYYDPSILDFFSRCGKVDRHRIIIEH